MRRFIKSRLSGKPGRLKGIKLPRVRKFEASLTTLSAVKVRSSYEKICADLLIQNGVDFQYEPLMLIDGRQFRPDFYLPAPDLFIEICGYGHMPHYRDRLEHKKRLYERNNLKAAFIIYNGRGSLKDLLIDELKKHGLSLSKTKCSHKSYSGQIADTIRKPG